MGRPSKTCRAPPDQMTCLNSAVDAAGLPSTLMNEFESANDPRGKKQPTPTLILIWVLAGGVGIYMLASGVIGIISAG